MRSSLLRRKGLVQRAGGVGRQIVLHHADLLGLGVVDIDQVTHAVGVVLRRPTVGDLHFAPGRVHIEDDEQVDRAVALVFVVVAFGLAGRGGDRQAHLADQLGRALVEADHRPLWDQAARRRGRARLPCGRRRCRRPAECTTCRGATASVRSRPAADAPSRARGRRALASRAICRQPPKVGAECLNWARSDWRGGRSEMSVPTAIFQN